MKITYFIYNQKKTQNHSFCGRRNFSSLVPSMFQALSVLSRNASSFLPPASGIPSTKSHLGCLHASQFPQLPLAPLDHHLAALSRRGRNGRLIPVDRLPGVPSGADNGAFIFPAFCTVRALI